MTDSQPAPMTDPQPAPTTPTPPPPPSAPAPAAASGPAMPAFMASMSRAELFIAGGALLVLVTDLVFVIFGPYSFSNVIWAAAAVSLVLVLTHGRVAMMSWASSNYHTLLSLGVLVVVLVAVRELLRDVRILSGGPSAMFLLGMVGLYVGVALMAFGGWQLWSRRTG